MNSTHIESMITLAQAQGWQSTIATIAPFIILFGVLYLLFIRPEQKRAKQHRELIQKLKAGDCVVTNSGIHGTIKSVEQTIIALTVSENIDIKMDKGAVVRLENSTETE